MDRQRPEKKEVRVTVLSNTQLPFNLSTLRFDPPRSDTPQCGDAASPIARGSSRQGVRAGGALSEFSPDPVFSKARATCLNPPPPP